MTWNSPAVPSASSASATARSSPTKNFRSQNKPTNTRGPLITRIDTNKMNNINDLIYPTECYKIVGGCFEVYNEKGCGFLEPVYHDCLELEFGLQQIPFVHEPSLRLTYKGQPIRHGYSPDFTCWDKIVLEIK